MKDQSVTQSPNHPREVRNVSHAALDKVKELRKAKGFRAQSFNLKSRLNPQTIAAHPGSWRQHEGGSVQGNDWAA